MDVAHLGRGMITFLSTMSQSDMRVFFFSLEMTWIWRITGIDIGPTP